MLTWCIFTVCVCVCVSQSTYLFHSPILSSPGKKAAPILMLHIYTQTRCPSLHFLDLCIERGSIHYLVFICHVSNT